MRHPIALTVLALLLQSAAGVAFADGALCQVSSPVVVAARAELTAMPESLPARFRMADALVDASCYHEAVHTLEDGAAMHPRSAELVAKLRNARTLSSEQDYFEGKERAELAARLSRNVLRCTRLADLAACDEALKLTPDDAQLLLAKGDALLKSARPAEAYTAYRRAQQLAPDDARIASQLAAARAEDEREIRARMASLRQQRSEPIPVERAPSTVPVPVPAPIVAARTFSNTAEPSRSH